MDLTVIAAVRPGIDYTRMKDMLGDRWIAISPKSLGYVFNSQLGQDVTLRVERSGRLGSITFYGNFPTEHAFEGLHLGMPLPQVLNIQPRARLVSSRTLKSGVIAEQWSIDLSDELTCGLQVVQGMLKGVTYALPSAVYAEEPAWAPSPAGLYPEPQDPPGYPFSDGNFKLLVLNSLLLAGKIQLGTAEQLAEHVLGRLMDVRVDGLAPLGEVAYYLYCYPLTAQLLADVQEIHWDGGNDIYFYIFPMWDGESSDFDVNTVDVRAVVRHLPNLRAISGISTYAWTPDDRDCLANARIRLD